MIIIITSVLYYLVFTNFDFRNFIHQELPNYDISFISDSGLLLIILSIGIVATFAISLIYQHFYFSDTTKMVVYNHVSEFTASRRKKLRLFAFETLFEALLSGLFVYYFYKDYLIDSFNYALEYFSDQSLIPYLLGLGAGLALVIAIFGYVAFRFIKILIKAISAFSGTINLSSDFCEECLTGGNGLIVLSETISSNSTDIDSIDGYRYVKTDVSYDSLSNKYNVSSTPKSIYTKKETTTTTTKKYYTCRCCGNTDVKTSVDTKKKEYYLNDRGNWRES